MNGGLGDDMLIGSEGDDLVNGGDGDDAGLLGAGDDTFAWNPGDDNDTLEGQAGFDTMLFNGASVAENIDVSANGGRVRFGFRDIANVVMDLFDVESIDLNALGGRHDRGQRPQRHRRDRAEHRLAGALGGGAGDVQPDNVIVNGTNGDDVSVVRATPPAMTAFGLAARVNITGAEAANDRLTVNLLAGDDVVDASGVAAGSIQLTLDGGAGADVLIGGDGNTLLGGPGDDVLIGGPGTDTLDGGGDDDVIIQLVGDDAVTSARVADQGWLKKNARIVDGKTVLDVGGKQHASSRRPEPARAGRLGD